MEAQNRIAQIIVDCAIKVHRALGPGLLESAYRACLSYELIKQDLKVEVEKPQPIIYDNQHIDTGYRIDILVDSMVVVELKVVDRLNDVHLAQILTYLKLSGCRLGLLLNFNVKLMKDGIRRVIL